MGIVFWPIKKGKPVGMCFVLLATAFAIVGFLGQAPSPIVRWFLASFFALYWPFFLFHLFSAPAEDSADDDFHSMTGCVGVIAVSFACIYDYFFPSLAQHRIYGSVPDYTGLKWTLTAYLLFGAIMSLNRGRRSTPRSDI